LLELNALVSEGLAQNYGLIRENNLTPAIQIFSENLLFQIDQRSFERIFDNLLANALRFSQGYLQIATYLEDGLVVLEIANDGVSVTEAAFADFFSRHQTYNQEGKNRAGGLGLAIVSELVAKTKGYLNFEIRNEVVTIRIEWSHAHISNN
jgi:signal transduction histidine kinase